MLVDFHFQNIGDSTLEVSLAKPPSESKQKEKMKREDQKRMMMMMQGP